MYPPHGRGSGVGIGLARGGGSLHRSSRSACVGGRPAGGHGDTVRSERDEGRELGGLAFPVISCRSRTAGPGTVDRHTDRPRNPACLDAGAATLSLMETGRLAARTALRARQGRPGGAGSGGRESARGGGSACDPPGVGVECTAHPPRISGGGKRESGHGLSDLAVFRGGVICRVHGWHELKWCFLAGQVWGQLLCPCRAGLSSPACSGAVR
jgi:hypothetical protein